MISIWPFELIYTNQYKPDFTVLPNNIQDRGYNSDSSIDPRTKREVLGCLCIDFVELEFPAFKIAAPFTDSISFDYSHPFLSKLHVCDMHYVED